ncbi:PPM-type phosphatase domain-containing protein [Meloidogyne graminicola]|uniref:PPM-type phosphatase domain-containing protein n=1 Tax=Meloidogyne graminicola TaxID=189291 RepID=A0A8S9ZTH1_9BILA|nr:PPM-type phosphatase domain-containing protein [Meloidogyne graminicola]
MNSNDSISQKRKSNTPIFSLYGSDDEDDGGNGSFISDSEPKRVKADEVDGKTVTFFVGSNTSVESLTANFLLSVCAARKGEREEMQDRHVLIDSFQSQMMGNLMETQGVKGRFAFYALFDGHAGEHAAEYCAKNFVLKFVDVSKKYVNQYFDVTLFEKFIKKIFIETYKSIDDDFLTLAKKSKPTLRDGTTSTTILILNESIFCSNIGDSKAVICRYKPDKKEIMSLQLTVDHSPMIFEERMRIQKAGGSVKDGRVMGILEISRSIGDGQMKSHGVICTPDIKKLTIGLNDIFLILACDGLWKSFTSDSAINFILDCFKRRISLNSNEDETSLWSYICDEICADAIRRGCGDNVSVIIVLFMAFKSKIPIAEINRENIGIVWPQLLNSIQQADIVAIDLEFSGLGDASNKQSFSDRYKAAKETVKTRTILSMGIATFKRKQSNNSRNISYKCKIFDILSLESKPFVADPEAFVFLSSHGFDFNRLFSHGIRYTKSANGRENIFKSLFEEILASGVSLAFHNGFNVILFI